MPKQSKPLARHGWRADGLRSCDTRVRTWRRSRATKIGTILAFSDSFRDSRPTASFAPLGTGRSQLKGRRQQMFSSLTDARQQLVEVLTDPEALESPLTTVEIEQILSHLAPQLWIAPGDGLPERETGTRFGGAPALPPDVDWPIRPVPADLAARAQDLVGNQSWILRHIERALPYEFLAQIELAEAGPVAAELGLPASGRLLFFWDGVGGLTSSEPEFARVLWDETPRDELAQAAIPPVLEELERAYDLTGKYKKPYIYPSRPMRLQPILHLPFCGAREMLDDPLLSMRAEDFDFHCCYHQLLRGEDGMTGREDAGQRRHRLMGTPEPEQDDPRFGVEPNGPADWQLLLQLDLGDLAQNSLVEGTVYFLIAREHLAARDFSSVRAVYSQT
ncbi:YwqG family protein [Bradyrhizobium arachidis]|uniref:YwqG family protein n=2 Tax=Bradyrhizobium TaxID=374 RepID=UPI002163E184|nr:YwqG family protein [Bradyrhizobium arachidis]UVO29167.1 DUF1963 domain-containing protein [Bradyrhizobium arachidis]